MQTNRARKLIRPKHITEELYSRQWAEQCDESYRNALVKFYPNIRQGVNKKPCTFNPVPVPFASAPLPTNSSAATAAEQGDRGVWW